MDFISKYATILQIFHLTNVLFLYTYYQIFYRLFWLFIYVCTCYKNNFNLRLSLFLFFINLITRFLFNNLYHL